MEGSNSRTVSNYYIDVKVNWPQLFHDFFVKFTLIFSYMRSLLCYSAESVESTYYRSQISAAFCNFIAFKVF